MSHLTTDDLADLLQSAVLLPVLRAPDRRGALEQVDRCASAGLPVVEPTTTTEDWVNAVRQVRAAWPSLVVGVGTVLEPKQAEAAIGAGAAGITDGELLRGVRYTPEVVTQSLSLRSTCAIRLIETRHRVANSNLIFWTR